MSMTKQTYSAPTLTYYGKLSELTQAGSLLFSKDITGDGVPELFYDSAVDGLYGPIRTVLIPGGTTLSVLASGTTIVNNQSVQSFDTNGDGEIDLQVVQQGNIFSLGPVIDVTVPNDATAQDLWDLRDGVANNP